MTRTSCFLALTILLSGTVAYGQQVEYVVDSNVVVPHVVHYASPATPAVVSTAPVVVQPAPVVVQRPTLFARPLTGGVSTTVIAPGAPIVVARPVVQSSVVAQPAPATRTVWYSAPAASIAPSLSVPAAAPAVIAAPVTTVVGTAPTIVYRPVTAVVPVQTSYYVGSGLIGQPKVYVTGQPVRNTLRFLSP
jgi:hypothetical protein